MLPWVTKTFRALDEPDAAWASPCLCEHHARHGVTSNPGNGRNLRELAADLMMCSATRYQSDTGLAITRCSSGATSGHRQLHLAPEIGHWWRPRSNKLGRSRAASIRANLLHLRANRANFRITHQRGTFGTYPRVTSRSRLQAVSNMSDDPPADSSDPSQRCADCGIAAPRTETNYTLISARHGWRLTFQHTADGRREAVWRCPACWERFRRRT
jgi:hypothetical protein